MYAVEIENPLERDAMMSRIISNLHYNVTYPDSTDPYEIMASLLQRNVHSTSNPHMIVLIFRFLQSINDRYGGCRVVQPGRHVYQDTGLRSSTSDFR